MWTGQMNRKGQLEPAFGLDPCLWQHVGTMHENVDRILSQLTNGLVDRYRIGKIEDRHADSPIPGRLAHRIGRILARIRLAT